MEDDGMQNIHCICLHENHITFMWAVDLIPLKICALAAGLERGPLSLMTTTEELLGRNSSGSSQEKRD
jgi:hypothetical protein